MIVTAAAKRYARALFELAKEKNLVNQVLTDLKSFNTLLEENVELSLLLKQPASANREKLLTSILKKDYSPLFYHFITLMLRNNRYGLFGQIYADFQANYDRFKKVTQAQVVTAVPLSEKVSQQLINQLKQIFKTEIRLESSIDPAILGGLIIRINGQVFNASVANKLQQLKIYLTKN